MTGGPPDEQLRTRGWSPGWARAWILDGLQIAIASSVTGVLTQPSTLDMTSTVVGLIASVYLIGALIGALVFGRLSDQLGRKRLLITTLLLYLLGTGLAAFVTGHHTGWLVFFYATRLLAGMGIGGQYAGDQLRDRRDDAVQVPRQSRHLDQRVLLGRGDHRILRFAHLPQRVRGERRLAAGLPDGPRPGPGRHRGGTHLPREPSVAADPRPRRGGRSRAGQDRGSRREKRTLEEVRDDKAIELVRKRPTSTASRKARPSTGTSPDAGRPERGSWREALEP